MNALLICIVFLCVAPASCNRGGGPRPFGNHGPFNGGQDMSGGWNRPHGNNSQADNWASKLCANDTWAQSYLTQTRQTISSLRSNGSFAQALQNRQQAIAYLEDENNTDLLSSNCTAFFSGLESARKSDRDALDLQRQQDFAVGRALFNIIQSLVGGKRY
ncbi:unnamed protein product [Rotaria sp. Silwood1]|nr:unnamed protein product [Rotaria sp. Silwood1]